jgi:zinc protease
MNRWGTILLLLLFASTLTAQEPRRARSLHEFTLDNGLEIIVFENHLAPLATVLVAVRGGAAAQRPGEEGLAHVYEHLLFRAYGGRPGEFGSDASDLNAMYNGTTSYQAVTYYLTLPAEKTEKGIKLLARLLTRPKFRSDDLEEERTVVLDELERGQSDPEQALDREVSRQLWGSAWHRRDVSGDSVALMQVGIDQITANYQRFYVPNNAALIVTGDVSPEKVVEAARRHFRDWKRGGDPLAGAQRTAIEELTGTRAAIVARDILDVTIRIALQGPSPEGDSAATYAADALFEILNDPNSAFQRRLVVSGLFRSLGCSYLTLRETGPIVCEGKLAVQDPDDALMALLTQLDSLDHLPGITPEHLAAAKKRREVAAALAREQAAMAAPSLAFWWAGAGMAYYDTYHERMNAQTLEDLRAFARRYLVNRPKVIGVVGPGGTMRMVADWLNRSAGTP